jgi:putative cell wall-binding protein
MAKRAAAGTLALAVCLSGGVALAGAANADANFAFDARVAGADRYLTAVQASQAAFPAGATVGGVVIVNAFATVDGLTASYAAGQHNASILYTDKDSLPQASADEIKRLGTKKIWIVGGTAVVSQELEDSWKAEGFTVTRLAGEDRYETAAAVATSGSTKPGKVFLASGESFADALVAGPIAYKKGYPILLAQAGNVPSSTSSALTTLGVTERVVIGGEAVISKTTEAELKATNRLSGADRQATAIEVAKHAIASEGFSKADIALVGGANNNAADALVAASLAGKGGVPLLFTAGGTVDADTAAYLKSRFAELTGKGYVFGGTAAVSASAADAATKSARTTTTNQSYKVSGDAASLPFSLGTDDTNTAVDEIKQGHRTYTVTGLDDTKTYNIALFAAASVSVDASGQVVFVDAEAQADGSKGNGVADWAATDGRIVSVNNMALASANTNGVVLEQTPVNGVLKFTIDAAAAGKVVPVVYSDGSTGTASTSTAPALQVKDGLPTVGFGIGGTTNWTASAAANQADSTPLPVTAVDKTKNTVTLGSGVDARVYSFDNNDTFSVNDGNPSTPDGVTLSGLAAALNRGDTVQVAPYYSDPALMSSFTITADTPTAPAVAAAAGTGANTQDLTVSVTPANPSTLASYDSIVIERTSGTVTTSSTWTTVATLAPRDDQDTTTINALEFTDKKVAVGDYTYRAQLVVDGVKSAYGSAAPVSSAAPAADTTAPLAIDTVMAASGGLSGTLDAGDTFQVVFNEAVKAPTSSSAIRLQDADATATVVDLTNGGNATMSVNTEAVTINGVSRSAGTVLTVAVTGAPTVAVAGSTGGLQLAATVTDSSVADVAGNALVATASSQDLVIEAGGADVQNDSTNITPASITTAGATAGSGSVTFVADGPLQASSVSTSDVTAAAGTSSTGTASITGASLSADGLTITVTFTGGVAGNTITLGAVKVLDQYGNASPAAAVTATLTA